METLGTALNSFATFMWGTPLVVLLVGGGVFFVLHSRGLPYRYFGHGFEILSGKYDKDSGDEGDITHFKALATALSGTLGLGNITGVAVAITVGGPGAIFWMWITAIVGIATKFYTASLAVMFRGRDDAGHLQGGPMYVIREGLDRRWLPLAWLFAIAALFGTLPIFQINQLVQVIRDVVAVPAGLTSADDHLLFDFLLVTSMASAVQVQTTSVSMNGPTMATRPSRIGSCVRAAPCASASVPMPASLENAPRCTPIRMTVPSAPPATDWPLNASSTISASAPGTAGRFFSSRISVISR